MSDTHPSLIHERVSLAREGKNPTVIARIRSGWLVLGDDQRLRGYTLLLADPIVEHLNAAAGERRKQFLWDMSVIGDALMVVLNPFIINYSILGNKDRALHAHIHPRYESEAPEHRRTIPFIYYFQKFPAVPFDAERDKPLMQEIREELARRIDLNQ